LAGRFVGLFVNSTVLFTTSAALPCILGLPGPRIDEKQVGCGARCPPRQVCR
ncbi:hypothetical protein K523DRAFT_373643, partial [Schizophyllum commune Tattone D]